MKRLPSRRLVTAVAAVAVLASAAPASADQTAEIAELKAQLRLLSARLEELEGGARSPVAGQVGAAPATAPRPATWVETIRLKGDLRYRHESFDIDGRTDRHRHRIRARATVIAEVDQALEVGIGLASGASDPLSTNQTLGDGFSSKNVVLDLAYVNWDTPIQGLKVRAGKFSNPLKRAGGRGLLWDGDLRPEGVGLTWSGERWFGNALGTWIDESPGGADALLLGAQTGVTLPVGKNSGLLAAVGFYQFANVQGDAPAFDGNSRRNRVDANGNLVSEFEVLEALLEYRTQVEGCDVLLYADYANNTGADRFETGYALGIEVARGPWAFSWAWQDVEADAVYALFSDSNFFGGGTDGRGHVLESGYRIGKRTTLSASLFLNERNVDFGTEEDFRRLMLDVSFKF